MERLTKGDLLDCLEARPAEIGVSVIILLYGVNAPVVLQYII